MGINIKLLLYLLYDVIRHPFSASDIWADSFGNIHVRQEK